jgi:hypothetical protein
VTHVRHCRRQKANRKIVLLILDNLYRSLPRPPFTEAETDQVADRVYDYVWHRCAGGNDLLAA